MKFIDFFFFFPKYIKIFFIFPDIHKLDIKYIRDIIITL